jgi:hypothetical protein
MGKAHKKSRNRRRRTKPRDPLANIPNKASIVATDTLTMPDGRRFTILETNQTDPSDPPLRKDRRGR